MIGYFAGLGLRALLFAAALWAVLAVVAVLAALLAILWLMIELVALTSPAIWRRS